MESGFFRGRGAIRQDCAHFFLFTKVDLRCADILFVGFLVCLSSGDLETGRLFYFLP